jgi:GLPGLI family protein
MQKLLLFIISALLVSGAAAQVKEGRIIYERKVNMHKRLPKEDESMKNIMPEFNISKSQLLFSQDESMFSNVETEPNIIETAGEEPGNRMVIRMMGQENETYKNYKQHKMIELRELGPKKYLIEDALETFKWQLKEDIKTIKGFNCKKAVTTNAENMEVIAWYTEEIPCPSGPENWGGLPGMILELDIDHGAVMYSAATIENNLNKQTVKSPTAGKKISREDFMKMMKESIGAEGPGRRVIIREID